MHLCCDEYLKDFEYLYQALLKHPSFLLGNDTEKFYGLYIGLQNEIYDYNSFFDAMTRLTMFFEDGHTNIEIPYTRNDTCIRLKCFWTEEHLFLAEQYENIEAGAEIISVEDVTISGLLASAANFIPHENMYLVKSRMIEYPYMNYHIFSEMNLGRMFGKKDSYSIVFCSAGKIIIKDCKLKNYDGYIDFKEDNLISYDIKGNVAVLHLDECIYNEQYKKTLRELTCACKEMKVDTLELDLSKNMGGSSSVIDEFIRYINIGSYHRYEMIDCTGGIQKIITHRNDEIMNPKAEVLFPDKIICRISNTTFSSARTFAVTLKDNGIATIVGEPSGGKPCSYGMPKRDMTPNCKVRFRVSRCLFLRPDATKDDEQALFPNV